MRTFGKIAAAFFFIIFFLLFLMLATVRFAFLNASFLSSSFERHQVYEKLPMIFSTAATNDPRLTLYEKEEYAAIAKSIKPAQVKSVVESNLQGLFAYIDGIADEIVLSINPTELDILGNPLSWYLSESSPGTKLIVQQLHGSGTVLLWMLFALGIVLVTLAYLSGKIVLLIAGIITIILGAAGRFALYVITSNTPMREPSQVLLVFISDSILPDIMIGWILFGIIIIGGWYYLKRRNKLLKKP